MAVRTNLAVDFESALQLLRIVKTERPGERPALPGRSFGFLRVRRTHAESGNGGEERETECGAAVSVHGRAPKPSPEAAPTHRPTSPRAKPIPRSNSAGASSSRTVRAAAR